MNAQEESLKHLHHPAELDAKTLSILLKAAADPLRLEILRVLTTDSFGVMELCHLFDVKQSSMSHHLKVLSNAQLVATRREGNSIFYRRRYMTERDATHALRIALRQTIDCLQLSDALSERVTEIHAKRALASQIFFAEHARQLKEKQDLIAAFDVYGGQMREMLLSSPLPSRQCVLEVGPGEGAFLSDLAAQFDQVIALDNSQAMLTAARQHGEQSALRNIQYIHADTSYCRQSVLSVDCTVINMVLHHTPSPAQIFADVACCLKPAGVLLVCDLCHHDQDWARTACGDLWLGFEPQDLTGWASDSGLSEGQSIYFALRNGFQVQLRQFIKEH